MNKAIKLLLSFLIIIAAFAGNISSAFAQNQLADGVYKIPFKILSDGKVTDKMDNNVINPAEVTVKDGKNIVTLTLQATNVLSSFKVEQNGSLTEPKVLNEDTGKNTKVVQFEATDLSQLVNAEVGVSIAAMNYNHTYAVQFQFDLTAIETISVSKPETDTESNTETNTEAKPESESEIGVKDPATAVQLKNGEYNVSINTIRTDSDETYPMMSYFENPVKLEVKDNKHYIYLNIIKGSSMIPYLEYEKNGAFVKMEEVSNEADSRIVKFEASNIGTPTQVKVHVSAGAHQATYEFRIKADTATIQEVEIEQPVTEEQPAEQDGQLTDGVYSLPFAFLVDGKETDKMDNNVVKPAQLTVKDGKYFVALTIKGTNVLTGFKVEQNGTFIEPAVLNSDAAEKTKTVQFEVANLEQAVNALVNVSVAAMNYNHEYNVQIQFDAKGLTAVTDGTPSPAPEGETDTEKEQSGSVNGATPATDQETTAETPEFNRDEAEKASNNEKVKSNQTTNAKTFDGTQIALYLALLVGSAALLVWRYRTKAI